MWTRLRALTVATLLCGVAGTGCAAEGGPARVVQAPEEEPTATYVPPVKPSPLFDLLTIVADFPNYKTAAEQMANIDPDAVLLGEVVSVQADPTDPKVPMPGKVNGAWLTVRPLKVTGSVPVRDDGTVLVEMYRPARVTAEWLAQAQDFGGDTLFILKNVGEPQVPLVTDPMGVYRADPDVGLRATAVGDTPAPADLRSLSPGEAFQVLSSLLR